MVDQKEGSVVQPSLWHEGYNAGLKDGRRFQQQQAIKWIDDKWVIKDPEGGPIEVYADLDGWQAFKELLEHSSQNVSKEE